MQQATKKVRRRRHFIREWAEDRKLAPADLARATGADKSVVSRWLGGAEPNQSYLTKLGELFGVAPGRLYERPETVLSAGVERAGSIPTFGGFVQAGKFLAVDEYFQQDGYEVPEFVHTVSSWGKVRQYAYQVRGHSMSAVGIDDGDWVVAADAADFIDKYGEIESGEMVVVERTRFQGAERELTVKEIRFYRDRYELHPRSTEPGHDPIVVPHGGSEDGIEVKIVGVLLTSYKTFRRPRTS
jgi:SOS-response transcriptional repressor LexA